MTTTPDADTYRRLDEALKAHRGDLAAYQHLGEQLRARRHLLDARYGNRRQFVRECLVPLGLSDSAAYKLVYDLEAGSLLKRGGFSAGTMLTVAQAYDTSPEAIIAALDGGDLEPSGRVVPVAPADDGWRPPLPEASIDRARPHADDIYGRLLDLARRGVTDPGGAELFPDSDVDAETWDRRTDMPVSRRVWLIAALRAREAAMQEHDTSVGLDPLEASAAHFVR